MQNISYHMRVEKPYQTVTRDTQALIGAIVSTNAAATMAANLLRNPAAYGFLAKFMNPWVAAGLLTGYGVYGIYNALRPYLFDRNATSANASTLVFNPGIGDASHDPIDTSPYGRLLRELVVNSKDGLALAVLSDRKQYFFGGRPLTPEQALGLLTAAGVLPRLPFESGSAYHKFAAAPDVDPFTAWWALIDTINHKPMFVASQLYASFVVGDPRVRPAGGVIASADKVASDPPVARVLTDALAAIEATIKPARDAATFAVSSLQRGLEAVHNIRAAMFCIVVGAWYGTVEVKAPARFAGTLVDPKDVATFWDRIARMSAFPLQMTEDEKDIRYSVHMLSPEKAEVMAKKLNDPYFSSKLHWIKDNSKAGKSISWPAVAASYFARRMDAALNGVTASVTAARNQLTEALRSAPGPKPNVQNPSAGSPTIPSDASVVATEGQTVASIFKDARVNLGLSLGMIFGS